MNKHLKVKEYVKNWMDGHEPDTFPKNEHGVSVFSNGATSLNIKSFFEDLLTDFIDDNNSEVLKDRNEALELLQECMPFMTVHKEESCHAYNRAKKYLESRD